MCGNIVFRNFESDETFWIKKYMQKNVDAIKSLGIKTLVLSCAGCYRMFKEDYPKFVDVPFKVQHMTEFLAEQELKLKSMDGIVTYHDPCHLGRHSGVYDAPRKVIGKIPGITFKEMEFSKNVAHCCGGGGGVRSAYPEESKRIASTRVDEAVATGAKTIITTCPFCVSNLILGQGDRDIKVVDLTELIDDLL